MESISADNNQMLLINSHSFLSLTMVSSDSKRRVPAERLFEECKKDRIVPLSKKLLETLRIYYRQYRPLNYLFEGQYGGAYSTRSAQSILKEAKQKAGIHKKGSIHSLRHSYATHLMEAGTDIRIIQELLGHNTIKTTMLYTHVSKKDIARIESPLDKLNW
jgi:integrase/recombinase XerD